MWSLSKRGMCVMGALIVLACIFTIATGLDVGVKVLRGGEVAAATCLDRLSGSRVNFVNKVPKKRIQRDRQTDV